MHGWIALWRNIRQHWIWSDSKRFQRWVDLLLMAQWEPSTVSFANTNIHLNAGQLVTSIRVLAHLWKTNSNTVSNFLNDLEFYDMIERNSSKKMTIITIVNWSKYQSKNSILEPVPKQKKKQQKVQIKKINNENNNLSLSRENCEMIFEKVKSNDKFWEDCCRSLSLEKAVVESLLNAFYSAKVDTDEFPDSYSKFKNYFLNWARTQTNKISNNGTRKQNGGSAARDRYDPHRGTEPADPKTQDYKGGF